MEEKIAFIVYREEKEMKKQKEDYFLTTSLNGTPWSWESKYSKSASGANYTYDLKELSVLNMKVMSFKSSI